MSDYPEWHPNNNELYHSEADDPFAVYCPTCGGSGVDDPNFDGWDDEGWIPCATCHGQGLLYRDDEV